MRTPFPDISHANQKSAHRPVEQQRRKSSPPRRCISTMAGVKNMVSSSGCAITSSIRRPRRPGPAATDAAVAGAASGRAEPEETDAGCRPRRRRCAWLMVNLCVCVGVDRSSGSSERSIKCACVPKSIVSKNKSKTQKRQSATDDGAAHASFVNFPMRTNNTPRNQVKSTACLSIAELLLFD